MKKFIAAVVLTVMAFAVMCSPVSATEPTNFNCKVTAVADREFTFLYPADNIIAYGTNSAEIGQTEMKNLFLYEDEALIITITTDSMVNFADANIKLPYTVKCKGLPSKITVDGNWPITIKFGPGVWKNAKAGDYCGKIYFTVSSSLTGETLLDKTTTIKVAVPSSGITIGDSDNPAGSYLPKTGDTNGLLIDIGLELISLGTLFLFLSKKKQKSNN